MSKPKIHWRPEYPISYPSGPGTMRTFVLRASVVCHADDRAMVDWSGVTKWVTCKRCLRIASIHRVDTEATIRAVLQRPDVAAPTPSKAEVEPYTHERAIGLVRKWTEKLGCTAPESYENQILNFASTIVHEVNGAVVRSMLVQMANAAAPSSCVAPDSIDRESALATVIAVRKMVGDQYLAMAETLDEAIELWSTPFTRKPEEK